jgi:energy-coupling factor transport system ATP-binding protein
VLEIQNVVFAYPGQAPAVKTLSLQIKAGEFVGLVGRNGSGKTTLTRLMVGLAKPSSGSVLLDGKETRQCGPDVMARSVGYVFQNPDRQIFRDTVAEEVSFGPEQLGWSEAEKNEAVTEALKMTGLTDLAGAYPRSLARSLRQKTAIASALALKPRLLILDEPTSGQDVEESILLMKLLVRLNQAGISILLVTHNMELLLEYTQRTVVMHQGSKVFDGLTEKLFFDPKNELEEWGLRIPTAADVALKLPEEIPATRTIDDLAGKIRGRMRGEPNEIAGSAV